eukprot:TRINITY_DN1458_c0_g1_i1.p1 TRINITY_DN1458_c0_g1~~TRINITY_DN1458_c0_g1_i1.p1  ORF type:complete len:339 (-),score=78.96 TRINITY_DN1458_c0_g1_i1:232-1197(-)
MVAIKTKEARKKHDNKYYLAHKPMILEKKARRQAVAKAAKCLEKATAAQAVLAANRSAIYRTEGPAPAAQMTVAEAAALASTAAVARLSLAQLEATATQRLATDGYIVFKGNTTLASMAQGLVGTLPDGINTTPPPWGGIFNAVKGTRFQLKLLPTISKRSPYFAAKKYVADTIGPHINKTLMGLGHTKVSQPSILLSKKTGAEDALAQGPHRDWPLARIKGALKRSTAFPVGVLMSLHDGGVFHLWPGSLDATEVRMQDRITLQLAAGDVILFHGALVHEGAGYQGKEGEIHLRLHFYTQTARGVNAWPIQDETERVHAT